MSTIENWLRLWHVPRIGPRTFNHLLTLFDDPKFVFDQSYSALLKIGCSPQLARAILEDSSDKYSEDLKWMNASALNSIITIRSPLYPESLLQIPDPPPILYTSGDLRCFSEPLRIAVVGSRKATQTAQLQAYNFSCQLASVGFVVVSGLARGIDYQAHQGAISTVNGKTIAVYASGLDITYPRNHQNLARNIQSQGLLVSEFPPGSKPLAKHFPRRNRIISGLCLGVIIIEAATKSGTLITANYAVEQGREVFAVPGPISNPLNMGCHRLIQEGAHLVTEINDVVMELNSSIINLCDWPKQSNRENKITPEMKQFLELIEHYPMQVETIIAKSGLTPEQVSSMLTELELGGHVICDAYGLYSRSVAD